MTEPDYIIYSEEQIKHLMDSARRCITLERKLREILDGEEWLILHTCDDGSQKCFGCELVKELEELLK